MDSKTILITGGSGFIGHALTQLLTSIGYNVRVFDVALPSTESLTADKFIQGNLTNFGDVLNGCRHCCGIVHLGGISRESLVKNDPLACIQTNIMGGLHILEALRRTGNTSWLLIGSSRDTPFATSGSQQHTSLYGISKFTVDMLAKAYVRDFGGRILVTRFADVYGSELDHPQKVLPLFFRKARHNEAIEVHESDRPFDFIHIDDLLQGIVKGIVCLESQHSSFFQDITLCTGRTTVLGDLAGLIVEILHSTSAISIRHPVPSSPKEILSNPGPAFELLGFRADTILHDGLKKMALMSGALSANSERQ